MFCFAAIFWRLESVREFDGEGVWGLLVEQVTRNRTQELQNATQICEFPKNLLALLKDYMYWNKLNRLNVLLLGSNSRLQPEVARSEVSAQSSQFGVEHANTGQVDESHKRVKRHNVDVGLRHTTTHSSAHP